MIEIHKFTMAMKTHCFIICCYLLCNSSLGQSTTGQLLGSTLSQFGHPLGNIRILLMHRSTNEIFETSTNSVGIFQFLNLPPGGPYALKAFSNQTDTSKLDSLTIHLDQTLELDALIIFQKQSLPGFSVNSFGPKKRMDIGNHQLLDQESLPALPSDGSFLDYLRMSPKISPLAANPGALSFGGQNNRFNAFYINGTQQQDIFGLSNTGTYGGQTGSSPISIESIEELQINHSPFDPIFGNFTGGLIQAITKSGTNQTKGNVYWKFNSIKIKDNQSILDGNQTIQKLLETSIQQGGNLGGAIIKQKLFYFLSWEKTIANKENNSMINQYQGNTKSIAGLEGLAQFLKSQYRYHPGKFQNWQEPRLVNQLNFKIDGKILPLHKISLAFRKLTINKQQNQQNGTQDLYFENNGFLQSNSQSQVSIEVKSLINRQSSNRLVLSYHKIEDKKSILGFPFPSIRLQDGLGSIHLGANSNANENNLINRELSISNQFKFYKNNQVFQLGFDWTFTQIQNRLIPESLGSYQYASVAGFANNQQSANNYSVQFSLKDPSYKNPSNAGIEMKQNKLTFYFSDEIRLKKSFRILLGFRLDHTHFQNQTNRSALILDSALPKFSQYYPLLGIHTIDKPNFPLRLSPRLSLVYYLHPLSSKINLGFGIFNGNIPLVWLAGAYLLNGQQIGIFDTEYTSQALRFKWNANEIDQNIWRPDSLSLNLIKYPINLLSKQLSPPKLIRFSWESSTDLGNFGTISTFVNINKNLSEISFSNLNILPTTHESLGAGSRKVYEINPNGSPKLIPIFANGGNPFQQVILLGNQPKSFLGNAIDLGIHYYKKWNELLTVNLSYQYGRSLSAQDGLAFYNYSNWANLPAVNGRNQLTISNSNFSLGHRLVGSFIAQWKETNRKRFYQLSLIYHAQSGARYSYTYSGKSPSQDKGLYGFADLIYIPTEESLNDAVFLPVQLAGITYSPSAQKSALNQFIQNDAYLKKHRGEFAERNGAKLPFSHQFDCKLSCWIKKSKLPLLSGLQISWQLMNLGHWITKKWGNQFEIPFNQVPIIEFAGYESQNRLNPTYRFDPSNQQILSILKKNYRRTDRGWSSQIGLKWSF